MNDNPEVTNSSGTTFNLLRLITLLILVSTWLWVIFQFGQLPSKIPIHFNAMGEADAIGDKSTIFLLPLISTILYFGISALEKVPHVLNYPVEITKENAAYYYAVAIQFFKFLKFSICLIFGFLSFLMVRIAKDEIQGPGSWFLPVIIGLILLPGAYFIFK
jgi:uncharacterized membrane protein